MKHHGRFGLLAYWSREWAMSSLGSHYGATFCEERITQRILEASDMEFIQTISGPSVMNA